MRPILCLLTVLASPLSAQEPFDFYTRGPYRPAVPRPDAITGYAAGDQHTMYAVMQHYLDTLVATAGKLGGTLVAARLTGMGWRAAASLGILMNTRGLMELIVLNIGLDLGVISPTLFTMMVLMALVTTIATTPVLRLLGVGELPATLRSEAHPAAPDVHGARDVRGVGP